MDQQLFYAEIIPNIWWVYHPSSIDFIPAHKDFVTKICEYHKIKEIIKIDPNVGFWNHNKAFLPEIEKEIIKKDFELLGSYLNQLSEKIYSNYINQVPTVIITIKNNDIGLANVIYYFKKITKLSIEQILDSLQYKIINMPNLSIRLKNFFQYHHFNF